MLSVMIDTPIWALIFRSSWGQLSAQDWRHVAEWEELVRRHVVLLVGPVRQEILSDIRDRSMFERCVKRGLRLAAE